MTSININEIIMVNEDIKRNIRNMSSAISDLNREIKKADNSDDDTYMIILQINKLRNIRDNMKKLAMTLDSVVRLYNKTENKAVQLIECYSAEKVQDYGVAMNDLTNVSEISSPYRIV